MFNGHKIGISETFLPANPLAQYWKTKSNMPETTMYP